ncbi:phosphoribosylamine--glycine ligase [Chloroflexota bacterium]
MNILVIGNGAREHTLVWKLAQSPRVKKIYTAPGNAGTALLAENLNIKPTDINALAHFAQKNYVGLTVVGPEAPLSEGITDLFRVKGLPIFGPTKGAAKIESSKVFSKELMQNYGIPCASSITFTDINKARQYIEKQGAPLVVKADGLAAGKGVTVAETIQDALKALTDIMQERIFGSSGDNVIIEEMLTGREMSSFAFSDGKNILPIVPACDHKRVFDGNWGPNTGGMGAYSPPFFYTPELGDIVNKTIIKPTVKALANEGRTYTGVLYAGLMVKDNLPKNLEFNARFGDPECQVTLPRLKSDLLDILLASVEGTLDKIKVEWHKEACVGVVMASGGYPDDYQTGYPITGLDRVDKDIMIFHAGTKPGTKPEEVVTTGGRVLTIAAMSKSIKEAREKVYTNISRISFKDCHYRKDIADVPDN